MIVNEINTIIDANHMLMHKFYQMWSAGELDLGVLQNYAGQYFHHVDAFPRYVSRIHSNCLNLKDRQVLLDNLCDEEKGDENHPELWLRFADGVGASREAVINANLLEETQALVNGFFELANHSYPKGLGALYVYERQVPAVAKSKIEGLKKFYGIDDPAALQFFEVHMSADQWHSDECANLIAKLSHSDQQIAAEGAEKAAKLLWNFLTGVQKHFASHCKMCAA
ncbi:MAG: CADD family putative folate metabolism protein [Candidatus Jidaibacter sp.]|jgi:pyrroloquinoline-quinone synthase|nr:CADD family putative folate metabolism protein [Candidatus Jidaibacter sp.]